MDTPNHLVKADAERIRALGGPTKVAESLNTTAQRVSNWNRRGIPSLVKLKFPHLFLGPLPKSRSKSTTV